jgi:hypothetical protein
MRFHLVRTWPKELRDYLDSRKTVLLDYMHFDREDMRRYLEGNRTAKYYHRKSNPHYWHWEETQRNVEELVQGSTIRGWHCTRLTDFEIGEIQRLGWGFRDRKCSVTQFLDLPRPNCVAFTKVGPAGNRPNGTVGKTE